MWGNIYQLDWELRKFTEFWSLISHWLKKKTIDFNTQMRTVAKTDFEKDLYKLTNHAVFSKMIENVRNRQNIRLTSWKQASKLINNPNFKRVETFSENFCAFHMEKESIVMVKHIYVGISVLDLSKLVMYDYFPNSLQEELWWKS